jgi:hypothetical protein
LDWRYGSNDGGNTSFITDDILPTYLNAIAEIDIRASSAQSLPNWVFRSNNEYDRQCIEILDVKDPTHYNFV